MKHLSRIVDFEPFPILVRKNVAFYITLDRQNSGRGGVFQTKISGIWSPIVYIYQNAAFSEFRDVARVTNDEVRRRTNQPSDQWRI